MPSSSKRPYRRRNLKAKPGSKAYNNEYYHKVRKRKNKKKKKRKRGR